MLSRRQVLGGMLIGGMAGCTSDSTSTANLFQKTVTSKPPSPDQYPLNPQQIHDLPYATLGIRIGANPKAVLVLATVDGHNLRWVSADRVIFITDEGWLVQTQGLPRDLGAMRWIEENPLHGFVQTGTVPARGFYRQLDLRHADEQAIVVESTFEAGPDETITIQGRQRLCRRIDEIADMAAWRWKTRNSFWLDPQTGRVWRSVQQYCPEIPPMLLEVLKPASA